MTQGLKSMLDDDILKSAFRAVVENDEFVDRMRWWIQSPHSAERWVQFELAYHLRRQFGDAYTTACEIERADIAVFQLPARPPLWENSPVAKIELKMLGNWSLTDYHSNGLKYDFDKVAKYPIPSALLVIWIVVDFGDCDPINSYLANQVRMADVDTFDKVNRQFLDAFNKGRLKCLDNYSRPAGQHNDFCSLDVRLLCYRNTIA